MGGPGLHGFLAAAGMSGAPWLSELGKRPWLTSLGVAAVALAASLWLWFGSWLWPGIPYLVAGGLPFLVGLLAPRAPLLFGLLPALLPYLLEGDVSAMILLRGLGAGYLATAAGLFLRRIFFGRTAP